MSGHTEPQRRTVLKTIGAGLLFSGLWVGTGGASDHVRELALDNVGFTAWELVTADDENSANVGEENPTLTLLEGERYEVENLGGSSTHPLEFRDADGNALLSQDTQGQFEDDSDVEYESDGETMAFTLTSALAEEMATYACTIHQSMEGDIETQVADNDPTLAFGTQATASSTFTAEGPTTSGVLVEGVTADEEVAVVVTYEDGEDLVVAGVEVSDTPDGENTVVAVEDAGGFPGDHVAHIIPTAELSGDYEPGDTVSANTADSVLADDEATVLQVDLSFEDQTGSAPIAAGDVMATVDVSVDGNDQPYIVDVHPTDEDGQLVGSEFVGSTDVLSGDATGAEVVAERVPGDGEFNELPFAGTDDFVAMIHAVDDGTEPGEPTSPGSFPVLRNVDAEDGPVPGGVTDTATVTAERSETDGPPPLPGQDDPPQDLDGDGLYEDIDGDGEFTVGDVQVFFQNYRSDVVQNNAEYFTFSESDPPEVSIGDVQALFQLSVD